MGQSTGAMVEEDHQTLPLAQAFGKGKVETMGVESCGMEEDIRCTRKQARHQKSWGTIKVMQPKQGISQAGGYQ